MCLLLLILRARMCEIPKILKGDDGRAPPPWEGSVADALETRYSPPSQKENRGKL